MSATNSTLNYELPQFIATDKPAWLVDFNGAMSTIDTAIKEAKTAGDNAQTTANTNAANITTLDGTVTSQGTAIGVLTSDVAGNTGSINTINSLIGNGQPTTTDKTIIGAINEINAKVGDVEAEDVSFNNANTGLVATNVQAAIVEVKGLVTTPDAEDVDYDNTASGLTATNVQDAIDELAQGGAGGADLNFVNHATATVTPATGLTLGAESAVDILANANYSIGKIYGLAQLLGTLAATVGWNTVATLSNTSLPTISEAYDVNCGCEVGYNGTDLTFFKSRLHFNTDGTVDLQLYVSSAASLNLNVGFGLEPCIFIFKNLGD